MSLSTEETLDDQQPVVLSDAGRVVIVSAFDLAMTRMYRLEEGVIESNPSLAAILRGTFTLLYAAFKTHAEELRRVSVDYTYFGPSMLELSTPSKTIETFTSANREELMASLERLQKWSPDSESH